LTGKPLVRSSLTPIDRAINDFHVGNLYVNRKYTGAVVGAHPFGGFNSQAPIRNPAVRIICTCSVRRNRSGDATHFWVIRTPGWTL
jgi:hypothetical protein